MKILGIDTTTKFLCIGLYDGKNIYEYGLEAGARHSEILVPTIQRILYSLSWKMNDIDYFACGLGPGSFTGVRIGLSVMKGLAWALGKPIVGVSTLDILASNAPKNDGWVAPIIDAKRNLVYTANYRITKGEFKLASKYLLVPIHKLIRQLKPNSVILGDGVDLYKTELAKKVKGLKFLDKDYWRLRPRVLIELARAGIHDKQVNAPAKIEPIYLYPAECQIKSKVKSKRPRKIQQKEYKINKW